jgi:hypothetical protein
MLSPRARSRPGRNLAGWVLTPDREAAVAVARLEGTLESRFLEVMRRLDTIEGQVRITNGRVTTLEGKRIAETAASAARAEVLSALNQQRGESRKARFAWVAAAGTVGGLITGAVALVVSVGGG